MIPKSEINRVKDAVNIVDVIESFGVSLKPSGSSYKGLCPFHDEGSPSFHVRPANNHYHCFGCGEGGDVFTFIQAKEGLTFSESVRSVADMYGIIIHEENIDTDEVSKRKRLATMMRAAADYFRQEFNRLPESHPAKGELIKRNLYEVDGQANWLAEFGIGYAPAANANLHQHLKKLGYTAEEQEEAGLIRKSKRNAFYDVFRGRLTWEIRDVRGGVIGFGARKLMESDKLGKYLNSSNNVLYNKSQALYGVDLARTVAVKEKRIYVVEGYTDVMAYAAAGVPNTIATCGTAFGEHHAPIVRRLISAEGTVVFVFDPDKAGTEAAKRVFENSTLPHGQMFVAVPIHKLDPCDLRLEYGDESILETNQNLVPITEFVLRSELSTHDINEAESRASFIRKAASILADIRDPSLRDSYVRKVAFWSGSSVDVILKAVQTAQRTASSRTSLSEDEEGQTDAPNQSNSQQWDTPEAIQQMSLLSLLAQYPQEAYYTLRGMDFQPSVFMEPLRGTASALWDYVKASNGKKQIYPEEFGEHQKGIEYLLYKQFDVLAITPDSALASVVARLVTSSWKAILDLQRRAMNNAMQRRLAQSLGHDGRIVDDLSILEDISLQRRNH